MMLATTTISITAVSKSIRANIRTYTMIIALALIWLLFGSLTHWVFFEPRNLSNLFRQMTIVSFLAIGMVLVITTGNIDLSVGSATGLVSAVTAYLQVQTMPPILHSLFPAMAAGPLGVLNTIIAILTALVVGLLIGLWQGTIIAFLKVPAFIVTLGGMLIFRGGVLAVTQGKTLTIYEDDFRLIAQGYVSDLAGWIVGALVIVALVYIVFRGRQQRKEFGFKLVPFYRDLLKAVVISALVVFFIFIMNSYRGIPNPVLLMAVVAVIFTYLANNTKFGRYSYALGGNKEATRLSGINIDRVVFTVFILIGLLTGVSGIVLTGYVAAGTIGGGQNYELDAIAACVIGGTSLMGGQGTIIGAIVGSLIIASLLNGMSVMNMDVFWQYIIRGLVIIAAVYIDVMSKRSRS
ncbi:MAG: sugar ABC transporter permease [Spirochaetia bacterium]|jgi:D-xylose transport system permease protein